MLVTAERLLYLNRDGTPRALSTYRTLSILLLDLRFHSAVKGNPHIRVVLIEACRELDALIL